MEPRMGTTGGDILTNRELDEQLEAIQERLSDLALASDSGKVSAVLVRLIAEIHLLRDSLYA